MYGGLAPNHFDDAADGGGAEKAGLKPGRRRRLCAHREGCRHAWLEAARNMHWFGHKPSNSQRYWVMEPACRAPRAVRNGRIVGGGGWKLPLRNCTVPYCLGRDPVE